MERTEKSSRNDPQGPLVSHLPSAAGQGPGLTAAVNCLNYQGSSLPLVTELFQHQNVFIELRGKLHCLNYVIAHSLQSENSLRVGIILFIFEITAVTKKIIKFLKILVLFM